MCVNERSYRSLPHYPELIRQHGVRQLHVDIVRPESTGERDEDYLRDIMPRYSDMAPYYAEMLDGFERWNPDFDVNVGNLPYCILPEWGSRIHHGGQETVTKSSDGDGLEDAMNKYEWQKSLRTHLPGCADCVFRSRCTGIFRVYLEMHGDDEFQPLTRDALAARDPERRNFVLLIEPLLAPLRAAIAAAELPAGWRMQQEVTEDRRRRVELAFAHDSGSLIRLTFLPAGRGTHPAMRSAEYDVDVEADLNVPLDALTDLLGWLRARLDGAALADDAVERSVRGAVLARGRQRVAVLAGRLQQRFALPGWSLEPLRWPTETAGHVIACGPAGVRLEVCFNLGVRQNRSQVGVEFQAGAGSDPDTVRAAVDALVTLLRNDPPPASASTDAWAAATP
jgi:hypothetical protein